MGIVRLPSKDDNWSTEVRMATNDVCHELGMARNRSCFLWRNFHCQVPTDADHRNEGQLLMELIFLMQSWSIHVSKMSRIHIPLHRSGTYCPFENFSQKFKCASCSRCPAMSSPSPSSLTMQIPRCFLSYNPRLQT